MLDRAPWFVCLAGLLPGSLGCTGHKSTDDAAVEQSPVSETPPADPNAGRAPEPSPVVEPPPAPQPAPGPPELRLAALPEGHVPLVGISQVQPSLSEVEWEPHEQLPLLMATNDPGCVVFDIASGRIIEHALDDSRPTLCDDWNAEGKLLPGMRPEPELEFGSFDDALEISTKSSDGLEILDARHQPLRKLDCDCDYDDVVWAPNDHRLVGFLGWPPRLDIWDADTGERLASHELTIAGELTEYDLGWNERGVVLLLEQQIGERLEASAIFWPDGSAAPKPARRLPGEEGLADVLYDDMFRWVFVDEQQEEYDGDLTRWRMTTIPLTDLRSALDWRSVDDYRLISDPYVETEARWRHGVPSQWIETTIATTDLDEDGERVALRLAWQAILVEPEPQVRAAEVFSRRGLLGEDLLPTLAVLGVTADRVVLEWALDELEPRSRGSRLKLGVPVGGEDEEACFGIEAAPDLELILADCIGAVAMIEPKRGGAVLELELPSVKDRIWGRSGWLAVTDLQRVVVFDRAQREVVLDLGVVEGFAPIALAPEQDRFGLARAKSVQLIDATHGTVILELPPLAGQAGLHPDGDRIAYIHEGQARVVAVPGGEVLASWPEPGGPDLAWQQDGAALLIGAGRPQKIVDPSTGVVTAVLDSGDWVDYEPEQLDPSWRWARLSDGRVLRTLDGLSVRVGPGWAAIDQASVYDGSSAKAFGEYLFRTGEDRTVVPWLSAAKLERWIRREGLLAAFFAGEAIVPASIPATELGKLGKR